MKTPATIFLTLLTGCLATPLNCRSDAGANPTAPRYAITDLGALGGDISYATGMNSQGQVVGNADLPGHRSSDELMHPVLWRDGKMVDLGILPGAEDTGAMSVNNKGQVVGSAIIKLSMNARLDWAFIWQHGKLTRLSATANRGSRATYINDAGQIVGDADVKGDMTHGFIKHAVLWQYGRMLDLGTLGGMQSWASSINNKGEVVGSSSLARSIGGHAFRWVGGKMHDIGGFDGSRYNNASCINDKGQIVGTSETKSKDIHAVLWDNGKIVDLGTLPKQIENIPGSIGGPGSFATSINNKGQIVGSADIYYADSVFQPIRHGFLYSGGRMFDLNNLIVQKSDWVITDATAINDKGRIAANGKKNGYDHALLLTPVAP